MHRLSIKNAGHFTSSPRLVQNWFQLNRFTHSSSLPNQDGNATVIDAAVASGTSAGGGSRRVRVASGGAAVGPAAVLLVPGPSNFFKKRIDKYGSTVFRTNVPPAFPFFVGVNPNVVAVLDVKSFGHLFEMEVVEKSNSLVGDFMPSVNYTGGLRVCAYLDTSEPKHSQVRVEYCHFGVCVCVFLF
ncbi:Fatty acid hydroperoxide lyase, chloroplastic [Sesamum angolense]|uniref:Fatty acid hydroperoxide lyase, chloroplastic n=1 Tax=Sesamum angolense TaxID=2727404 RepID=A0AAE1WR98_9LAMI|nr:Fatty acid hydroperoxide lyase, chloroplastic [Sesamum angolense]